MATAAKQKNKAKKQTRSAAPYVRRLVGDERVHEQLRSAASALLAAYSRASKKGTDAVEDKRVYASLRQAAISIHEAATRLQQPKPEPKRRVRKLGAAALAGASVLLVIKQQKARSHEPDYSGTSSGQAADAAKPSAAPDRTPEPEHAA